MKDTVGSTAVKTDPVRTCRSCGEAISKDAPFGYCPKCLLSLGFIETSKTEPKPKSPAARLRFGDYELIEQIGRGGMGVVYKARQASLNRVVALKMVLDSHLASPVVLRRFLIEAEAAAKLDHTSIVPIYEIAEIEGQHFFSMRLIDGESLERKIALGEYEVQKRGKGRFTGRDKAQAKVATLMATVARAVHYAHERGVLHRDLKPSNILIDKQGQPHLTDFGLAKIADKTMTLTPATTVLGTPGYMAPEQAMGAASQAAGDVYSLGAILYELLTGKPPFDGPTAMEILRRTKEEEPISPRRANSGVDDDLATICLKCLEKDAGQRYVSAQALAEDLERWLRREPIQARPIRMPGRIVRWCRREPMLAAATISLAVLIVGTALLTTVLYRREKNNRQALEQQGDSELRVLTKRIARDADRGDRVLRISSGEMAVFLRQRPPLTDGTERSMTVSAISAERNPDRMIKPLSSLLSDLRGALRKHASTPVLFDLRLHSRGESAAEALGNDVDLAWTDAAIYVLARREATNITPVVKETYPSGPEIVGMIVTSFESGITNLADVKGRSFVFGDRETAIGWYLPRAALVKAGIRAADVRHTNAPIGRVLNLVRLGVYDAGAILSSDLQKLTGAGGRLRILAEFRCASHPWVFTRGSDATTIAHFRAGFLTLRDSEVLARLGGPLTGFVPASASDYDELEKQLDTAHRFDAP